MVRRVADAENEGERKPPASAAEGSDFIRDAGPAESKMQTTTNTGDLPEFTYALPND